MVVQVNGGFIFRVSRSELTIMRLNWVFGEANEMVGRRQASAKSLKRASRRHAPLFKTGDKRASQESERRKRMNERNEANKGIYELTGGCICVVMP